MLQPRSLLLVLICACGGAHADIYRFVGGNGSVVYSDVPPRDRAYEVVARPPARPESRAAAAAKRVAVPAAFDRARFHVHIEEAARAHQVDPALVHAVIAAESGYNPRAVSPKGAVGLMQLMPETARRYRVRDSFDPVQNIHGGTRYLADLLRMFGNDPRLALAAYNAGENAVMKYGNRIPPYAETMAYVPRVLAYYQRFRGRL